MSETIMGNNLKSLRAYYNESQKDLADVTGIPKTKISNWENGHENPGRNYIEIICEHYRISPEDFQNKILFEDRDTENLKLKEMDLIEFYYKFLNALPIVSDKNLKNHPIFCEAYKKYKQTKKIFKKDLYKGVELLDDCIKLFNCSYKKEKCIEALINETTFLIIYSGGINDPRKYEIIDNENLNEYNLIDFAKLHYLKNNMAIMNKKIELRDKNERDKVNEEITNKLEIILKNKKYNEIGLCLCALRYFFGFSFADLENYESSKVGLELMLILVLSGNKYMAKILTLFGDISIEN